MEKIYIRCGYTDMRKQLNGLLDIIQYNFKLDPYSNSLFLFCGKRADRIKAVHYEGDGFCLLYKRYENGRLQWPRTGEEAKQISDQQLRWLLEGLNPEQDFLGSIFMELNLGDKSNSQFFTPYHVCELMAKVTEEDVAAVVKEKGYITINDSCCGAGATLIAAINEARKQLEKVNLNFQNHVLVVAQDIDEIVALMCYIQLSLLGVAAYIKVGDVFTQPMSTDDNGENYWFTMMYFSDVWTMRRVFHSL